MRTERVMDTTHPQEHDPNTTQHPERIRIHRSAFIRALTLYRRGGVADRWESRQVFVRRALALSCGLALVGPGLAALLGQQALAEVVPIASWAAAVLIALPAVLRYRQLPAGWLLRQLFMATFPIITWLFTIVAVNYPPALGIYMLVGAVALILAGLLRRRGMFAAPEGEDED